MGIRPSNLPNRPSRRVRDIVASALLLTTLLAAVACTSTGGTPTPASTSSTPVPTSSSAASTSADLGHGLVATVPDATLTPFAAGNDSDGEDCVLADATIEKAGVDYRLLLVKSGCPQEGQRALNGRHGYYLVPPSYALDTTAPAAVPTGSLVTFRQVYTECTNSCTDYTDSVGLITLSKPADADAPVLMILLPRQSDERLADVAELAAAITNG